MTDDTQYSEIPEKMSALDEIIILLKSVFYRPDAIPVAKVGQTNSVIPLRYYSL